MNKRKHQMMSEEKEKEAPLCPLWIRDSSSWLYATLLDNSSEEEPVPRVPEGAPPPLLDDAPMDAALMYRNAAYWSCAFDDFPQAFFDAWFQLDQAERAQLVDDCVAFCAELHPDTCAAYFVQQDADDKFMALVRTLHRSFARKLFHTVLEKGAVRCFTAYTARLQPDLTTLCLWMETTAAHGNLALVQHMYSHYALVRMNMHCGGIAKQLVTAALKGGNLALLDWLFHESIECRTTIRHCFGQAVLLWNPRSATSTSAMMDWLLLHHAVLWSGVFEVCVRKGDLEALTWLLAHGSVPPNGAFLWTLAADKFLWTLAADKGRLPVMEWLADVAPLSWFRNAPLQIRGGYAAAARNGDMALLQWLRLRGVYWRHDEGVFAAATQSADWHTVMEWLRAENYPYADLAIANTRLCPYHMALLHSKKQHMDIMQWLHAAGYPMLAFKSLLHRALTLGYGVSTLEWILLQDAAAAFSCDGALMSAAVHGGQTEAVEWMRAKWDLSWSSFCMTDVLGAAPPTPFAPMLAFLRERGATLTAKTLCAALSLPPSARRKSVVDWLIKAGCPWDYSCMLAAAKTADRPAMLWLRRQGCPWIEDVGTPRELAWIVCNNCRSSLPMIQWLYARGYPWHPDIFVGAAIASRHGLLEWLRKHAVKHGLPMPNPGRLLEFREDICDATWQWISDKLFDGEWNE